MVNAGRALSTTCPFPHLRDFDVRLEVALEAGEEHLALGGLQAVHQAGDGAHVVRHGKEDELLADEVRHQHAVRLVVHVRARDEAFEPLLAVVGALLGEGEIYQVPAHVACDARVIQGEGQAVAAQVGEVLLGLHASGGAETLVVLDGPALQGGGHRSRVGGRGGCSAAPAGGRGTRGQVVQDRERERE